jgi:hypothetical protein
MNYLRPSYYGTRETEARAARTRERQELARRISFAAMVLFFMAA